MEKWEINEVNSTLPQFKALNIPGKIGRKNPSRAQWPPLTEETKLKVKKNQGD
jgi:hypothetical protein